MKAWYERSFGEDYLIVYKHRDLEGARHEVRRMIDWLGLPQGARVFDLCCGMGRHSLALADFGYRVTGMDLSETLLSEARRMDTGGRVTWLRGDMRGVPVDGETAQAANMAKGSFDAVVNLFTSFGYFNEDGENAKVLGHMASLLKPGGKFIIDYLNPSFVAAHLVPSSERRSHGLLIRETRTIEQGMVKKEIVLSEDGTHDRIYHEQVKLYGLPQFEAMTAAAGLSIERVYGGYDERVYDPGTSPRLIMVGRC